MFSHFSLGCVLPIPGTQLAFSYWDLPVLIPKLYKNDRYADPGPQHNVWSEGCYNMSWEGGPPAPIVCLYLPVIFCFQVANGFAVYVFLDDSQTPLMKLVKFGPSSSQFSSSSVYSRLLLSLEGLGRGAMYIFHPLELFCKTTEHVLDYLADHTI